MATRSPEIEAILRDGIGSVERGDADRMEQLTSADPDALAIGTDASEWAQGREEIMRLYRDSGPDGSLQLRIPVQDISAYADGDVGWAAARIAFEVDGAHVPVRLTAVLRREDGEWRLVQTHASIGVPNDQMANPMFAAKGAAGG